MRNKKILKVILTLVIFGAIIFAESYNNFIIEKNNLSTESGLQGVAKQFAETERYLNFVKHEGIVGRDIIFKEEKIFVDNIQKSYVYPGKIPANTGEIADNDEVNIYTLFNVAYFIEKKGVEEESPFANYSSPSAPQTMQGLITSFVYNKTIGEKEEFNIYIIGNQELTNALQNYQGQRVGDAVLTDVSGDSQLPETPPTVLFIGKGTDNIDELVSYCRENDVMSVTNNPEYFNKGVTVGIGLRLNQVRMILNNEGSQAEGLEWSGKDLFYRQLGSTD